MAYAVAVVEVTCPGCNSSTVYQEYPGGARAKIDFLTEMHYEDLGIGKHYEEKLCICCRGDQ